MQARHRHYLAVAARAHHWCEYRIAPERVFNLEFEMEHIVPSAIGGADDLDNLALACRACDLRRGITIQALDP